MTELHEMLVKNGNFAGAETFLEDCSQSHLFHKFIMEQDYKACWNQIVPDLELDLRDEPITVLKPRYALWQTMISVNASQDHLLKEGIKGALVLAFIFITEYTSDTVRMAPSPDGRVQTYPEVGTLGD